MHKKTNTELFLGGLKFWDGYRQIETDKSPMTLYKLPENSLR